MMPFKPILMSLKIIFTLLFSLKSPKIEIMLCNEKNILLKIIENWSE